VGFAHRHDADVEARVKRNPGVEYRIGPLRDPVGVGDRGVKQAVGVEFLLDLRREQVIQPLGVLAQQVNLGRACTKLSRPFDPGEVADHEPALAVFQPQGTAVMVLERAGTVKQTRSLRRDLVHFLLRREVIGRVRALRVIGDIDRPRMRLGLGVLPRVGYGHRFPLKWPACAADVVILPRKTGPYQDDYRQVA
jgi:hypothetical protein